MPTATLRNNTFHINYDVHGRGPTKILLIMGLFADGGSWDFQTNFFKKYHADEYQCVSYDNRGIHQTKDPVDQRNTTELMAEDAYLLATQELGWDKFHVCGISMGGMISQKVCIKYPQHVLSLTLFCTHMGGPSSMLPSGVVPEYVQGIKGVVANLNSKQSQVDAYMRLLYSCENLKSCNPGLFKMLEQCHMKTIQKMKPTSPLAGLNQLQAVLTHYIGWDRQMQARYTPCPKVVVHGSKDLLVRPENGTHIARSLGADLIEVEDAGHGLVAECADFCSNIIKANVLRGNAMHAEPHSAGALKQKLEIARGHAALRHVCTHHDATYLRALRALAAGGLLGAVLERVLYKLRARSTLHRVPWMAFFASIFGLARAVPCAINGIRAWDHARKHLGEPTATHAKRIRVLSPALDDTRPLALLPEQWTYPDSVKKLMHYEHTYNFTDGEHHRLARYPGFPLPLVRGIRVLSQGDVPADPRSMAFRFPWTASVISACLLLVLRACLAKMLRGQYAGPGPLVKALRVMSKLVKTGSFRA